MLNKKRKAVVMGLALMAKKKKNGGNSSNNATTAASAAAAAAAATAANDMDMMELERDFDRLYVVDEEAQKDEVIYIDLKENPWSSEDIYFYLHLEDLRLYLVHTLKKQKNTRVFEVNSREYDEFIRSEKRGALRREVVDPLYKCLYEGASPVVTRNRARDEWDR